MEGLRRQRRTGHQIAAELQISPATVSRILKLMGLNRINALEPAEPVPRYQRERPGEMIHIDIKKLGRFNRIGHRITGDRRGQSNSRGVGWEFVHVAIDDHSRIAFAKIMGNERKRCATAFLKAAVAYYQSLGITVERVIPHNGSSTSRSPSAAPASDSGSDTSDQVLSTADQRQAQRFIQTSLREWAYAQAYQSSRQRKDQLPAWLHHTIGTGLMPASVMQHP